jgi:benzoyl-CoA reductase/2-hydroxyglutaryl-CoA dehydratase subunit BcrC/BadD/HgdB
MTMLRWKSCEPTASFEPMTNAPITMLTDAFNEQHMAFRKALERKDGVVVLSWPSVPVEIVRAAGLNPLVVRGGLESTPSADAYLEAGVFPRRLRWLAEAALSGYLSSAARIVFPRTSDPDYKCFLYFREFGRLHIAPALPPVSLFDLLQSDGPNVRAYNAERTRALLDELTMVSGRSFSLDDVRREIERVNVARAAARRLAALRSGAPRVNGTELFPLLGAFWSLDPDLYAALAGAAADELASRPVLNGPRILLAGAPVDGPGLHSAIESRGALVVAELGPWGSAAAGDDVLCIDDPIAALADKYCADTIGPRTPIARMRRAVEDLLDGVDAVVISLPLEDTVFGWDYPWLRNLLENRCIPHTCLNSDSWGPVSSADHERLDTLMSALAARAELRRG